MNRQITDMLESITTGTYTSYSNYLDQSTINQLLQWFSIYATDSFYNIEDIVSLMYELYAREDIDSRPYGDFSALVNRLSQKYRFDATKFLDLYQSFRQIVFRS